jgi:hypothetical protein
MLIVPIYIGVQSTFRNPKSAIRNPQVVLKNRAKVVLFFESREVFSSEKWI